MPSSPPSTLCLLAVGVLSPACGLPPCCRYRDIWEMYKKAEASFWTGERCEHPPTCLPAPHLPALLVPAHALGRRCWPWPISSSFSASAWEGAHASTCWPLVL